MIPLIMKTLISWDFIFFLYSFNIRQIDATCSFPSELTGTWYSSHKGAIQLNSSYLTGYPIYMSATVNSLDFKCDESSGDLYMLKSVDTVNAFGSLIDAYLCIELHRISEYKYYYYLGTNIASTNNDYIYGRTAGTVVPMSEACNRATPYETGTFIVLIKDGAVHEGNGDATCPKELLAFYTSVTTTNYDGSSSCTGTSVDGCTDTTALQYTYAGCTSGQVFSSDGLFYCLYYVAVNDVTYLSVWNNDTTVDGTSTYRFTCYALQSTDGITVYATEFPNFCSDTTQDATTVSTPGIKLTMTSANATCVVSIQGSWTGGFTALVVVLILVVVGIVIFVTVILIRYQKHKKSVLPHANTCNTCVKGEVDDEITAKKKMSSIRAIAPQQLPNEVQDNAALKDVDGVPSARLPPLTPKGDNTDDAAIQPKLPPIKPTDKKAKKK